MAAGATPRRAARCLRSCVAPPRSTLNLPTLLQQWRLPAPSPCARWVVGQLASQLEMVTYPMNGPLWQVDMGHNGQSSGYVPLPLPSGRLSGVVSIARVRSVTGVTAFYRWSPNTVHSKPAAARLLLTSDVGGMMKSKLGGMMALCCFTCAELGLLVHSPLLTPAHNQLCHPVLPAVYGHQRHHLL